MRAPVDRMKTLLKGIGKGPGCLKRQSGVIIPGIQALAMNEAVHLLEEGVASAEDIDTASNTAWGQAVRFRIGWNSSDMGGLISFITRTSSRFAFKDREIQGAQA